MKVLDQDYFTQLSAAAQESERQRSHALLHTCHEDSVQRLCIALEPTTYVRPHRHDKWESIVALKGAVKLNFFDDSGAISESFLLAPNQVGLVEIPPRTWHNLVSLESGSVVYEFKPGPFTPVNPNDFAAWAPEEGSRDCQEILNQWRSE